MPDGIEQSVNSLTVLDALVVFGGVALFARWLLTTSLGRDSLANSKPRRHGMAPFAPVVLFLVWLLGGGLLQMAAYRAAGSAEPWRRAFLGQLAYTVASLGVVALILILAKFEFARGLKGLGLRLKTIPKDLGYAFVTLLAVWPLVLAALTVTLLITRAISGPDYRIPPHEALKLITESPAVALKVLLAIVAVGIAPVIEELLFRGLFQTTIRSYLRRPWPAIVLTSLLFTSIHLDVSHWPALFVLSLGLGYAYEKSGSLWRPIFMHALFNGITVVTVLTQAPPGL
ncbi:MAG: CPBP family intramembrane metalloprotease [Planctomycetes bacterium]|nr:CPBP family intramembrane metalloprotease [Planctomycetota bacterium]